MWNYKFVSLMLISIFVDFFAGRYIYSNKENAKKKRIGLLISIVCNLGLLGFFKYYNFATQTANSILSLFQSTISINLLNIILPVGISFYTFQTLSYSIDIFLGKIKPTKNFFEFSCYVSLFPQLVAGPIVRYSEIVKDLDNINNIDKYHNFEKGIKLFVLGLLKKIIIADQISKIIDPMFGIYYLQGFFGSWIMMLGYTFQLFFDFSGYSDMAIGLGYLFGFKFPQNFNQPYIATNISDFWRRWHISLSNFLRDYVYISWLGGNRVSKLKIYFNLIITMVIGGLWHGANWTFVVWGLYHGILLAMYKIFNKQWNSLNLVIQRTLTFVLVVFGWVFFRSSNFKMASTIFISMLTPFNNLNFYITPKIIFLIILLAICFLSLFNFSSRFEKLIKSSKFLEAIILGIIFVLCVLVIRNGNSPFLYYQF